MEVLGMLFGMIFWPVVLTLFWRYTKRRRWSQSVRIAVFLMLLGVPALGALSMAHWMFLDEPLVFAAREGDFQKAKLLLRWSAFANTSSKFGYTPLAEAAANGDVKIVKLLLDYGANPQGESEIGTPLAIALSNVGRNEASEDAPNVKPDYPTVIKMLKAAGAR